MKRIQWAGASTALVAILTLVGCDGGAHRIDGTVDRKPAFQESLTQSLGPQRYLARGQRVPASDTIRALPAPYLATRDGAPGAGSGLVRVDLHGVRALTRSIPRRQSLAPTSLSDGNAGLWLTEGRGVSASASAGRNIYIPFSQHDSLWIYAPTHLPHGGSCLEISTVHWKYGPPYVGNMIGIWDWCIPNAPNFAAYLNLDDYQTQLKYLRWYTDEYGKTRQVYMMSVFASNASGADYSDDTWTFVLYNFETGSYEYQYSSAGVATTLSNLTNGNPSGWSMWESHGIVFAGCPAFPSQTTQNLQVRTGGSWQVPTGTTLILKPDYTACRYSWIQPNSTNAEWIALTPIM